MLLMFLRFIFSRCTREMKAKKSNTQQRDEIVMADLKTLNFITHFSISPNIYKLLYISPGSPQTVRKRNKFSRRKNKEAQRNWNRNRFFIKRFLQKRVSKGTFQVGRQWKEGNFRRPWSLFTNQKTWNSLWKLQFWQQ